MRIIQINTFCGMGSTGRIATDLYKSLENEGNDCFICYGRGETPTGINAYRINSKMDVYHHALMTRITGKTGFYSANATKELIRKIDRYNPDVIHLHNIHGYYININLLFKYIKKAKKPVVWTLHDCWTFTGHCSHFDYIGCDKWKTGCYHCPQKNEYPKSILTDNSKWNYKQKKKLFTMIDNMVIVTPSKWLANLVKMSFLNKCKISIINNGIDPEVFKPCNSNFREKYNLQDKFIILGVANVWNRRKGLASFVELSKRLDDKYKVVLVGLTSKQISALPENILKLAKTNSVGELAELYTMADVYVNPTLEDNFPTTNLEALSCGTPIITYATGGSSEALDKSCGISVGKGNLKALIGAINKMAQSKPSTTDCTKRAMLYDKKNMCEGYLNIYSLVRVTAETKRENKAKKGLKQNTNQPKCQDECW